MLILIKILKKLFAILHSNATPSQIAGGVVLGSFMGLAPFLCLHKLVILLLIFFLNVNIGASFLSILIFSLAGLVTDPLAHHVGYALLVKTSALTGIWTALYNMPVVPFTRFYNTIVLGNFVIAVILILPVFLGAKKFVVYYREHLAKKVENWKIIKMLKFSGLYRLYSGFSG